MNMTIKAKETHKCRHIDVRNNCIVQIEGPAIPYTEYLCMLKLKYEHRKIEICTFHLKQGFRVGIDSNVCPLANPPDWTQCPFYEK